MAAAPLKAEFSSVLAEWQARPAPELVRSGVGAVDTLCGGLPRGCLTEVFGPASSGRTTLLVSVLAEATARGEVCALIDAADALDPAAAAAAGVRLDRLLWVRCGGNVEHALKAADLLVQGGGFGVIALDLADTPPETARRISLTSWFRLRRAVEHTPAVLLVTARQPNAKTCASLLLEMAPREARWSGAPGRSQLLRGLTVHVTRRKPAMPAAAAFHAVEPSAADAPAMGEYTGPVAVPGRRSAGRAGR